MPILSTHQTSHTPSVVKWWSYKLSDVWHRLDSSEYGLKTEEALKRQKQYGFNFLPAKKEESFLSVIFRQARSVLMLVLFSAALISLFL